MGSSKDYIALPADEKTSDSPNPPPPPYEEKHPRFPLRWKVVCLVAFVALAIVCFSIHPNHERDQFAQVDLGFPQGTQQHNLAQEALTDFMTHIVREAEQDHYPSHHHRHHHHHHHHHHRHEKQHNHYLPQPMNHKDHHNRDKNHHPHDEKHHNHADQAKDHHRYDHHHRHHHRHQKREDENTVYIQKLPTHNRYQPPTKHILQRRDEEENDNSMYVQHLPTHNHYQPPIKHMIQRREEEDDVYTQNLPTHNHYQPPTNQAAALPEGSQQWIQSYQMTPSTNASLHILSAHVHSLLMGNVTLRQDTTGTQQDIMITFCTNAADSVILSTKSYGDTFFVRARSVPHHDSSRDYSINIVFPSNMTSMKNLNIHINNGTIHIDSSLQATFDTVKFSVNYGTMSIQELTADRIMLGTYSGVIAGNFQPKYRFAIGAYYGHSNVRLLQPSVYSEHCRHLHIAASSPHGESKMTLEHGSFDGQFLAYRTLEDAPKVNFTSNDKQRYEYQIVDQQYSGWFMNNSAASQLNIHGLDETALTFE